ncbi:MAG: hypothetical protein Q7T81_03850 [Pseudolabrys sp.]|nr:hypothetical protein [Pseudolabrys sp.]
MRKSAWLLIAVLLAGCSKDVGPTEAELKARWEAGNVYPDNYKRDLLAFMRTYLNDPTRIRGASVSQPARKSVGQGERYVVCVRYTERKENGTYGAPKDGAATFVANKLDRFFDDERDVKGLCKDAVLGPFPEMEKVTR